MINSIKKAKGTPFIIVRKQSPLNKNKKENINLVRKLIQLRKLISLISYNPGLKHRIQLFEKFQEGVPAI